VKQRPSFWYLFFVLALFALFALAWKAISGRRGPVAKRASTAISSSATATSTADASREFVSTGSPHGNPPPEAEGFSGVLTYHYNNALTGANLHETILTPSNVNAADFGKLFTVSLDGDVYAQPLYVPRVAVPLEGVHDIVYAATEHNTVYAIDADDPNGLILWSAHLGEPLRPDDLPGATCTVIVPTLGITGTPVIDAATHTLYVVSRTFENSRHEYRLHALDISTGEERHGSPVVISPSVQGTGAASRNGKITFEPTLQLQRLSLVLFAGKVYVGFGSNCDYGEYHGWLLAYDASTLAPIATFVSTPNALRGGIWEAGAAPAVDQDGNVYVVTGDGTFDGERGGSDYGDTVLKLSLRSDDRWQVLDYFTPFDQEQMDVINWDLGSSGAVLLPDQPGPHPHLLVTGTKGGAIYVVDRDNMGHFRRENDDQIVQALRGVLPRIVSTAAYWEGTQGSRVYISGVGGPLQEYSVIDGKLSSAPVFHSEELFGFPGPTPAISANDKANGIVWVVGTEEPSERSVVKAYFHHMGLAIHNLVHEPRTFFHNILVRIKLLFHSPSIFWHSLKKLLPNPTPDVRERPAILRAYDAGNVSNLLYSSTQAPLDRDRANLPVKFVVPTIANGKVYFGTQGHLEVYGLLNK
jgi:outer membrane protein assembly factor BamB